MGKGAFMIVTNNTDSILQVKPAGRDCMENMGNWNFSIPKGKNRQDYIEAKASGQCAFKASVAGYVFSKINSDSGDWQDIGNIDLRESGGRWSAENTSSNVQVRVEGGGDQDKIHIDLFNPR